MAEMDVFERRVADALRAYATEMPACVDAAAVADRVADERARRWRAVNWGAGRRSVVWAVALVAALIIGLLATAVFVGGWRPDMAVVIVPPPSPSAPLTAREATILATTKAHALPAQATCPPGSDPDALGPANQDRPAGGAMAFDRHAGRIVVLAQAEGADEAVDPTQWGASQTWTYDVCNNTWKRMNPPEEPNGGWGSPGPVRLVYDADSDRTLAFAVDDEIWSYNLAADRWARVGSLPVAADGATNILYGTTFYHDPSGLVVHYDGLSMWAYDVDTSTFSEVHQRPDATQLAGAGLPQGKIAFGYDSRHDVVVAVVVPDAGVPDDCSDSSPCLPGEYRVPQIDTGETWTFSPGTGAWRKEVATAASDLIVCGVWWRGSTECYQTFGRAVFDEASGLTLFITRDYGKPAAPGRVDAYDAGTNTWHTLSPATGSGGGGPYWCSSTPPAYDPLSGRIVCEEAGGVSSFSTTTGEWRWLLEPLPGQP